MRQLRWVPIQGDQCPYKGRKDTDTHRERHMTTEAEIEGTQLEAKGHQQVPGAPRS